MRIILLCKKVLLDFIMVVNEGEEIRLLENKRKDEEYECRT